MYFLALLSHDPVFEAEMATWTLARVSTPKRVPTVSGLSITSAPGGIISQSEASVDILTQ